MTAHTLLRGGAVLRGLDEGAGTALLFQHGLGGAEAQVADMVPPIPGIRRLTLECRDHGRSTLGDEVPVSIAMFADDALAFCDALGIARFVAGGISMGAALALRLAVRHPDRVRALILARPAWLVEAAPPNMRFYAEVASALRDAAPGVAKARFERSPAAALLAREAPDNLASLLGFFDRPDPEATAGSLEAIAADGPGVTLADLEALALPTLVIGHGADLAHPLATAQRLADTIPGADLVEVPPKAGQRAAHVAACRAAIGRFLHGLGLTTECSS